MEGDMKYCGIDLHSNNSVVVITNETDHVLYSKRLPNDLTQIVAALELHRAELTGVVVESTYNWYWLVDGLIEAGYRVHLANTAAIKQYDGLKHRGDESDARHLAHVLRLGLLPEGHIMPKDRRAVRDLARKRMQLVQCRTTQILSIENGVSRHTGGSINSNSVKRLQDADLEKMQLGELQTLGIKANVAVMQALQAEIDILEKALIKHCRTERVTGCSKPWTALARRWPRSSCWRPETSRALPMWVTTPPIAAALAASMNRTARRRAKATPRTAIAIWRGRLSRQPISRCAFASPPGASTRRKKPRKTAR
jgi:hypothetical protein